MRRKLVFGIILLSALCVGWWGVSFLLSHKQVSFNLQGTGYSMQIRSTDGRKIKELSTSETVTLRTGEYLYSIIGEGFDGKGTLFSVKGDETISIQPEYLESYLSQLAEQEKQAAASLLSQTYPDVGRIAITRLSLDRNAQWGYGKLQLDNNETDIYRFILKRDGESWKIHVSPRIVIAKDDAKDVPEEIIYSLY